MICRVVAVEVLFCGIMWSTVLGQTPANDQAGPPATTAPVSHRPATIGKSNVTPADLRAGTAVIGFEEFDLSGATSLDVPETLVFPNVGGSCVDVMIAGNANLFIYDLFQFGGDPAATGQALIDWAGGANSGSTLILFSQPILGFSIRCGDFGSDDDTPLTITAFDADDNIVGSDSASWPATAVPPFETLQVIAGGIRKVQYSSGGTFAGSTFIDDLTLDLCDAPDADGDTFTVCCGDCDDGDQTVYPGAPELCDAKDNDCDDVVDNALDTDGDGTNDCFDDCPNDANKTEPGICGCGVLDDDTDGDGHVGCVDNCPTVPNPMQEDGDNDGIGDACEPPAPVLFDSSTGPMNRFISFVLPPESAGESTALRVTLTTLNRPRFCCNPSNPASCNATTCGDDAHCTAAPFTLCAHSLIPGSPNYSDLEDAIRYVNSFNGPGGSLDCPDDGPPFNTSYKCATLGCEPEFRDWTTDLSAPGPGQPQFPGLLFVTGDSIVPSSTLVVQQIPAFAGCGPTSAEANACPAPSAPLAIGTAKWADISGVGFGPPDGKSDVLDIPPSVNKLKTVSPIFDEPRLWLKQRDPVPHTDAITVIEISDAVDGGPQEKPYPASRTIDACPHD